MSSNKLAVIGLGYVGLPVLLAIHNDTKIPVVGFDISKQTVQSLSEGKSPVLEEATEKEVAKTKGLKVTYNPQDIADANVYIVCVPTPVNESHDPDYGPVISASRTVGKLLKKGDIYILESTVNPGTCEEIVVPILEEESGLKFRTDFDVVHTPERINPGDDRWTVRNLPRVIGGSSVEAAEKVKELYSTYIKATLKVVSTIQVAESAKILENSFRDVNIAFINEMARSFDTMGIDLLETIEAASTKPLGFMPFFPGPGVGGHCIAVDPYYLIHRASKFGFNHRFLKEARVINDTMPEYSVNKLSLLLNEVSKPIRGTKVALLGLSYKANIGDLRESPALHIQKILLELGADLIVYDPFFPELSNVKDMEEVLSKAEALLVAANHKEFTQLTVKQLEKSKVKAILDSRNCLSKDIRESKKIKYAGIGRN